MDSRHDQGHVGRLLARMVVLMVTFSFCPAGHPVVRLYVGAEWCSGRGTGAGCVTGQTEGGNCNPGAHGHAQEGADIPGL